MKDINPPIENSRLSLLTIAAQKLSERLIEKKLTVTTAESCTGGWLAKCLTDIPGSSHWFDRGFVTYTNESKHDMLGVDEALIKSHGAVSEQTVQAMAKGALQHSRADVSLAITGIAGPGGGSAAKPVGLIWFAWLDHNQSLNSEAVIFDGDREAVRQQAVEYALAGMLKILDK